LHQSLSGVVRQSEKHVLPHRELANEPKVLKCARDTKAADAEGREPSEFYLAKANPTGSRAEEAGNEVQYRSFARSVATDQTGNGPGTKPETRPLQNRSAGEAERYLFDCEHR